MFLSHAPSVSSVLPFKYSSFVLFVLSFLHVVSVTAVTQSAHILGGLSAMAAPFVVPIPSASPFLPVAFVWSIPFVKSFVYEIAASFVPFLPSVP